MVIHFSNLSVEVVKMFITMVL